MGDGPSNPVVDAVNQAIEVLVFDVALNAVRASLLASEPWLNLPVVNAIFNGLLDLAGKYFYTYLSQVATFSVLDMQTGAEQEAYQQALLQLQAAYTSGDPNAISTATTTIKSALASLIHFDGSSLRMH